ncbi:MAG TPA: hypothetical protein VFN21_09490 [Acidimicrobiales bacterium]|nr:hypothetical protein [Acidimicrobiales bacterium]
MAKPYSQGHIATEDPPFEVGWATSIGALPHDDPAAATELILRTQPDLPATPNLPQRSPLEGMLQQAMWGIPGVTVDGDGQIHVDASALGPESSLEDSGMDAEPYASLRAFLAAIAGRTGPVKTQLTGPVTLGLALTMHGVDSTVAFLVAERVVTMRAAALVATMRASLPDARLVVFLDEPALVGTAQLGFPLDTDAIIDLVSGVLAALEHDATTGVHCCGEADWQAILGAGPKVLSLPVGAQIDRVPGSLTAFLEGGGWIAWGAVPTSAPVGERAGLYWKTLSKQWCSLVQQGADPVLIRRRSLITPHCGLAEHGPEQAEHVLKLCALVAGSLQEQAVSVKLSVGA